MTRDFDNTYSADLVGLWDFLPCDENKDTGLDDGIAQNGTPVGGAQTDAGWLLTDGHNDRFEICGEDDPFDLSEGTIVTEFKQHCPMGSQPNTVISRGVADQAETDGFFEIRVTSNGAVEAFHVSDCQSELLSTEPGFIENDDVIKVSYSWSETTGPKMLVENVTQGTSVEMAGSTVGMSMDIDTHGGQNFIISAQESSDDCFDQHFNGAVDYLAVLDQPVIEPGSGDGVVQGTDGDDLIDLAYTGDPDGDMIDAGDAIQSGQGPNDDIVDAGAGDDVVLSGLGDDDVYAGSGADTVYGGSGDDVIHGDSNAPEGGAPVRESFEWDKAPDPNWWGGAVDNGDDLSDSFTQNTGSVDVTYSVVHESAGVDTEFNTLDQNVDDIDTDGGEADDNSALESVLNGQTNSAEYKLEFSQDVTDVSFRINDIDGDGVVRVQAFDANGDLIPVTLAGGDMLTLIDTDAVAGNDTADSNGGYGAHDNPDYSVLVSIPGPVSHLVISHDQDGGNNTGVTVTDVFFDVPFVDTGADGDDVLFGGSGDDMIYGEGGDDSITGGSGSDTVDGGDGDDVIVTGSVAASDLPDLGFPSYLGLPAVPADPDVFDDRDVVDGGAGDDLILTGDDVDRISGGAGNDTIHGGLDADIIDGGEDDDRIIGGEGSDVIDGGAGDDTIYGGLDPILPDVLNIPDDGSAGPADPVTDNGRDLIDGGDGNDVIFGQDDDDTITGGAGDDIIDGGIDDDLISGNDGEDTLIGGQGDDVLLGGAGADSIFGGDDQDTIGAGVGDVVEGGEGGADLDTLIAAGLATVEYTGGDPASEAGTVTFYNEDLSIKGTMDFTEIEQVLVVGTQSNATSFDQGGPGTSSINGVVDGTSGDDLIDLAYTGDPEGDMIDNDDAVLPLLGDEDIVLAGDGDDTVLGMEASDVIFGGAGDDVLMGNAGGDAISGGDGDDSLEGGAGRDILAGGQGDDTISGGATTAGDGGDLMFGGTGDDTFVEVGAGEVIDGGEDADGQDIDVLDLTGAAEAANAGGSLSVTLDGSNPENGVVSFFDASGTETGTTAFSNIEQIVPCFTPGTLIATPRGEMLVEDLQVGDRVITRDNGIQEIRWVGAREMSGEDLAAAEHLSPVLIRQGALGNGLPERDMMVSPNHRVLVANDKTALYFEDREVLVAAKHLTGLEGVDQVDVSGVTYIHFMFAQHEVVLSDGAWTESFQPGDLSLKGIGNAQRIEILELFPELDTSEGIAAYSSARRSLKKHEARLLM